MKKNYILIFISALICLIVIKNRVIVMDSVKYSFNIWQNNLFPSLFPFLIIGDILINLGIPEILGELLNKTMYKLFRISGVSSFILFLSMISGFPSSAKYTKELLLEGKITEEDATKILTFTHFSNPLFILGTVSIMFLNNKEIGIYILISHYLGNIIIAFLGRNYYKTEFKEICFEHKKKKFGEIITNSITSTISTLLLILGTTSIFLIITSIINNNINISNYSKTLINGIFELTQGLKSVSMLNISLNKKALLTTAFISFGGLSIHMQIISIISGTKIKYFPYFISRIFHAIVSTLIFYLWKVL